MSNRVTITEDEGGDWAVINLHGDYLFAFATYYEAESYCHDHGYEIV